MTEEHISNVELYVRITLWPRIIDNANFDRSYYRYFFGDFPEGEFQFGIGEKLLILEIAEYVKDKSDMPTEKANLGYFAPFSAAQKRMKLRMCETTILTAFGLYFGRPDCDLQPQSQPRAIHSLDEMRAALFKKVQNIFDSNNYRKVIPLSIDLVTVTSSQNSFEGSIRCVFCSETIKLYCDSGRGRCGWVVANLKRHIKRHRSDVTNTEQKILVSTSTVPIPPNELAESIDLKMQELAMKLTERSIEEEQKFSVDDWIYTRMYSQLARLSAVKNLKSKNLFGKKGSTIKIYKIDGDGNCLYNALAHQIYYFGIGTAEHIKMGIEMRQKVIKHINDHFESYSQDLKTRVFEIKSNDRIKCMEIECQNFLNESLAENHCWCGTESLKAISEIYNVNIVTIREENFCNMVKPININFDRVAILAYGKSGARAREKDHYDSVVEIREALIREYSKDLAEADRRKQHFIEEIQNCDHFIID